MTGVSLAMKMLACVLLAVSGAGSMSLHHHQSCTTDRDCTQPHTYCYQTGKCVSCTDCSLYNRFPGVGCAKNKNQCGKCLPGMDTEYNLDSSFSCHPSGTITPSTQTPGPDPPDTNFTVTIIVAAVVVLLLIMCICTFILYKYTNTCVIIRNVFTICPKTCLMNNNNECSKCPDTSFQTQQPTVHRPPPYSETNPTAPPFEDPPVATDPDPPIYQKVYRPVENDPSQTANAYINPHYIRGGNLGTNPEPEEPEEELEAAEDDALINATTISQPDDEETQPSTWTPTPGSEAGSTGPTSFAGALSLQQLRISQPDVSFPASQGASRSNSHPSIQFNPQNQSENAENTTEGATTQQINVIQVGPFYITPTVSK